MKPTNITNQLTYSPEHYRERLSAYAAHTIDIDTPLGVFRQKANKQEDATVVDEGNGRFRIYIRYDTFIRFASSPTLMSPDMRKDAFYIVTVTPDDVIIKAQQNKLFAYFQTGFLIICLPIAFILLFEKNRLLSVSLLATIPLIFLTERANKKWLQNLIVNFLNNV